MFIRIIYQAKLNYFFFQLPRKKEYNYGLKDIKMILQLAAVIHVELQEAQQAERSDMGNITTKINTVFIV